MRFINVQESRIPPIDVTCLGPFAMTRMQVFLFAVDANDAFPTRICGHPELYSLPRVYQACCDNLDRSEYDHIIDTRSTSTHVTMCIVMQLLSSLYDVYSSVTQPSEALFTFLMYL